MTPDRQAAFAVAVATLGGDAPPGVTARDPRAAASRFAVHRANVRVGLANALERKFPVVARLVGEPFFAAMARDFAEAHPPESPVLVRWGDDLPAFIAALPAARSLPYLADVARFELAVSTAYHAADDPVLEPEALSAIAPDVVADLRVQAHAAAGLVSSPDPVGSIWSAHQGDGVGTVERWGAEHVLVTRPHHDIRLTLLEPPAAAFVAALLAGACLADALPAEPDFDPGAVLVGAVRAGAFTSLFVPSGNGLP